MQSSSYFATRDGNTKQTSHEGMSLVNAHRDEVNDNETEIRTNKDREGISAQEEGQEVKKRRGARERRLTK